MSILSSTSVGIQKYLTDKFEERNITYSVNDKKMMYRFEKENNEQTIIFSGNDECKTINIFGDEIICKYKCENQQKLIVLFRQIFDEKKYDLIDKSFYKTYDYYFYNCKFYDEKFILKHFSHIAYSDVYVSKQLYNEIKTVEKYKKFIEDNNFICK